MTFEKIHTYVNFKSGIFFNKSYSYNDGLYLNLKNAISQYGIKNRRNVMCFALDSDDVKNFPEWARSCSTLIACGFELLTSYYCSAKTLTYFLSLTSYCWLLL